MPAQPDPSLEALAARLLDAQTAFIVDQLTGPGLAGLLERDVDDLLTVGESLPLRSAVPQDAVKAVLRRLADATAGSPLLTSAIGSVADTVYDLPTAADHALGDVVAREHVDALVAKLLSMHRLQDRAMDRMLDSPAVGSVAGKFVGTIVNDFVQENRQRVEKLPGAKSLMSIGLGAANRVRSATADTFLADAAGKGAQYAIRRTNSATRDIIREAPLHEAALELWDLQAAEPMSDLRAYLTAGDVRDLVRIVQSLVTDARATAYAGEVLDACVDAFYDSNGDTDVTALLGDLGLGRDDLVDLLAQLAPPLLDALRETGALHTIVRDRLAPFFASDAALAVLGAPGDARPATTTKKKSPKPGKA